MVLYTKCVYSPVEESDGLRICIMSRLTENDGVTPVPDLAEGKLFDYWAKILAPPEKLVGSFLRDEIVFEKYKKEYLAYLSAEKIQNCIKQLVQLALTSDITLLCAEQDPKFCHRKIFAEECQRLENRLQIKIK